MEICQDCKVDTNRGYDMVLDTDEIRFGGHQRLASCQYHAALTADGSSAAGRQVRLYLPNRCALVLVQRGYTPPEPGKRLP